MHLLRKRNYFLSDTFQTRFLVVSLVSFALIVITFLGALFVPLMVALDDYKLNLDEKGELANQFLSLHERLWIPLLVVMILLAVHSIFFSHRIAGPLYRFRGLFEAIGEGNLTVSANIRKGDYLQKEAECLNRMINSLRGRVQEIDARCGAVGKTLEELNRAVERGSLFEADQVRKKLGEQTDQLRGCVAQFKTSS